MLFCRPARQALKLPLPSCWLRCDARGYHHASPISRTPVLSSWNLQVFRREAFNPGAPHLLLRDEQTLPEASKLWFSHGDDEGLDSSGRATAPSVSELRADYWRAFEDTLVPLELTTSSSGEDGKPVFHRSMAPLKLMLDFLARPGSGSRQPESKSSIYLAQCPLPSLPAALQQAVPVPDLVMHAGRGDVYDSSLWMGPPPTYTPLHRDPNPNLFIQLAGRKGVRLLPPEVGDIVFERVQELCHGDAASKNIRGEEMMLSAERHILEAAIWGEKGDAQTEAVSELHDALLRYGQEAYLGTGDALFIPKGWWHSVRGVGEGITASVNWWFR